VIFVRSFKPREGSFEANPPFDDATISRMVAHMEALLAQVIPSTPTPARE
jgi:hypothetical protein